MDSYALLLFVATAAAVGGYTQATTQYHAQDEWGQYAYGYSGGPSAKHEQRTADGVTRGGYSYVDAHGVVQSVSYVSDPVNGFRAAGTNVPTADQLHVVPVVGHPAAVAVHDVRPAVHSYSSAVVHHHHHHDAVAPVPVYRHVVPAVASVHPYVVHHDYVAPLPVVHSYGSAVVHPPPQSKAAGPLHTAAEHPVLLAARRKKRSVVYYDHPAVVHHRVAFVVPVAKPAATSYTSVTRHEPAAAPVAVRVYGPAVPVLRVPPHVYRVPLHVYADGRGSAHTVHYAAGASIPVHHVA